MEFKPIGEFISSEGIKFTIFDGYRDWVKPDWREMLIPRDELVLKVPAGFTDDVARAERKLVDYGYSIVGKRVLEFGCNNCNNSYSMACLEGTRVHAIDILDYGILQSLDIENDTIGRIKQQNWLDSQRERASRHLTHSIKEKVTIDNCSITDFEEGNIYDLVISWDTMEHVTDYKNAVKNISNALVSGGVTYIEYNPFFSITGGHSLCTLDFPYGHCILSSDDFYRYISMLRKREDKIASNFYKYNLNRMSITDLHDALEDNDLDILCIDGKSFFGDEEEKWRQKIESEIYPLAKRIYPNTVVNDFLYDTVIAVARKR